MELRTVPRSISLGAESCHLTHGVGVQDPTSPSWNRLRKAKSQRRKGQLPKGKRLTASPKYGFMAVTAGRHRPKHRAK